MNIFKSSWDKLSAFITGGFFKLYAGASKTLKEWTALVVVVLLFFASNSVLRWIDPTAGTYDAGVLQVINFTLVKFAIYSFVTWSCFKVLWPDLGNFMKNDFQFYFKTLQPWQKISISIFVFCFYFLMLVLLNGPV